MSRETEQVEFTAGITEQGAFVLRDPSVRVRLAKWRKHGDVTVIVRRYRIPKTNEQLGYYHSTILPAFAEHVGDDEDSTHRDLKEACLPKRYVLSKLAGKEVEDTYSLADATMEEMREFMDRVIRLAASIGLPIAPPKGSPDWHTWMSL